MTTASLTWGCGLLAFSPLASLLFLIAYRKAQLIIVVTTSAFAFLLSTVVSSLLWLPVRWANISNSGSSTGEDHPLLLIVPGVLSQAFFRCAFVWVYHGVEQVIERSIQRHENAAAAAAVNNSSASESGRGQQQQQQQQSSSYSSFALSESSKLRLELNDWACGLAAGTGFGGMHAILLYGTLLATESGKLGTLYQPSCSMMPGLLHGALQCHLFFILDVFLMLFTFYGMRRRQAPLTNTPSSSATGMESPIQIVIAMLSSPRSSCFSIMFSEDRSGGTISLIIALLAHFAAALSTTANAAEDGCVVSLPLLASVITAVVIVFLMGVAGHYLPLAQRQRQARNNHNTGNSGSSRLVVDDAGNSVPPENARGSHGDRVTSGMIHNSHMD